MDECNFLARVNEWADGKEGPQGDSAVQVAAVDGQQVELWVRLRTGNEASVNITFRLADLIAAVMTYMPTT